MLELNCKKLMRDYLLEKHPVFYYRYIIALFCTLLIINIIIYSFNINTLPILSIYLASFIVFFAIVWIFKTTAARSFSNEEYDALVRKCQMCIADPNVKNIEDLTKEDFANYTGLPN